MQRIAPQSLTVRQAEIAAFVITGKSSREIGELLELSPRTVQTHVAAIFNKLGVRSRVELTAALLSVGDESVDRAAQTNLPLERTSLIGRRNQIADIVRMLPHSRLVTVNGAGGIGKTRTAYAAGTALVDQMPAGVWVVEFAPLTHASLVPAAIAQALLIQESSSRTPLQTLLAYFKNKALLLILDNCEHVIEAVAACADSLLRGCGRLQIIATSREPLRVAGEQTYRLPSLTVPADDEAPRQKAVQALRYSAVELFVERARSVDHAFTLSDEAVSVVVDICRRLDGIPLAIELAAARVKSLSVWALCARLDQRLGLLSNRDRLALPRHQTMRALIDWSYDLLSPAEQRLFERLSIFAGGCTVAAAAALSDGDAVDEIGTLDAMSSLVDKSLVVANVADREPRYRLLESSRQYAFEKLVARGERSLTATRHAGAYLKIAERLCAIGDTAPDYAWHVTMKHELENCRVALDWAFGAGGDIVLGQRLAAAMQWLWVFFGVAEGRRKLIVALEHVTDATPLETAVNLRYTATVLAHVASDHESALADALRLIPVFDRLDDKLRAAGAHYLAGISYVALGRFEHGAELLESALLESRSLRNQMLAGLALEGLTKVRSAQGDLAGAHACLTEALAHYHDIGSKIYASRAAMLFAEIAFLGGDAERAVALSCEFFEAMRGAAMTPTVATELNNLAAYYIACDNWVEARARALDALEVAEQAQWYVNVGWALQHLAAIAALSCAPADPERIQKLGAAARLMGYVDAFIRRSSLSRSFIERQEHERVLSVLGDGLASDQLGIFGNAGESMTRSDAISSGRSLAG